jgi:hypothetical protein
VSALDQDLREMFGRREADVRPPQRVPMQVVRRARRRQVGTVVAGLMAGLALAVGSFAVVRSMAVSTDRPSGHGSPSSARVGRQVQWYLTASATGSGLGGTWRFTASHTESGRLCLVLRSPQVNGRSCGGLPGATDFATLLRPTVAGQLSRHRGAAVFGSVGGRAASVELRLDGGETLVGQVIPSREAVFNFFVIVDHPGHGKVVAIDSSGKVFASRRV